MKPFVLTPRAERDLNEIWDHVTNDHVEAADRVLAVLETMMNKTSKDPGIGYWREELADKRHRFALVSSYLIVYGDESKPVQIVLVLHAARNLQGILGLSSD